MNLINFLDAIGNAEDLCGELGPVLKIVGIIVLGIQIAVPIILIVMGMIDFSKAVMEKSEDKIKDAQKILWKRAIAAAAVFLVITVVKVVMNIIGDDDYRSCLTCIQEPFNPSCNIKK